MRFSFKIGKNVPDLVASWTAFANASEGILEESVKPGAGLIADEVRKAIEDLPLIDRVQDDTSGRLGGKEHAKNTRTGKAPKGAPKGVTRLEKEGLLEWAKGTGMGLAPMRKDKDFINTKLGFAGYNKHYTPKYKEGHPNVMVARAVEHGTSFRQKTPFISPVVRRYRGHAEDLMAKEFDKLVAKYGASYKSTV